MKNNNVDKINELNARIENSPKASKVYRIVIRIFAAIIILMGLLLCFAVPVAGIIGILIGVFIWIFGGRVCKNPAKSLTVTDKNTAFTNIFGIHKNPGFFDFPEMDAAGHTLLNVYNINVVGVLHEHDGIDPQTIIPQLYEGEQMILEADPSNKHDEYAVKVKTITGEQVGWLPQGANLQIDIFNRLTEGQTVYARVKKGYLMDRYPGKVGLVIDIARYSKR